MHLGSDSAGPLLPLNLKRNIREGQYVKSIRGRVPVKTHCLAVAVVRQCDSSPLQDVGCLTCFPSDKCVLGHHSLFDFFLPDFVPNS